MIDQRLAQIAPADQQARETVGNRPTRRPVTRDGPVEQGMGREGRKRRLFRRLPDHGIAADQRQRRIPRPDGHRKVEGRDDPDHAQRMPGFHHPVQRAFRRDGQPVQLARQTHGEIADINHLLHFPEALGRDLADLDRDKPPEVCLVGAQFFPEQADQLAAQRGRNQPPVGKCPRRSRNGRSGIKFGQRMEF